jgi:sulfur carrier protein
MRIVVNGRETELAAGATVQAALEALEVPASGRGVAVAVDAEVVPRGRWPVHELEDGARVEVVRAIQGG